MAHGEWFYFSPAVEGQEAEPGPISRSSHQAPVFFRPPKKMPCWEPTRVTHVFTLDLPGSAVVNVANPNQQPQALRQLQGCAEGSTDNLVPLTPATLPGSTFMLDSVLCHL